MLHHPCASAYKGWRRRHLARRSRKLFRRHIFQRWQTQQEYLVDNYNNCNNNFLSASHDPHRQDLLHHHHTICLTKQSDRLRDGAEETHPMPPLQGGIHGVTLPSSLTSSLSSSSADDGSTVEGMQVYEGGPDAGSHLDSDIQILRHQLREWGSTRGGVPAYLQHFPQDWELMLQSLDGLVDAGRQ